MAKDSQLQKLTEAIERLIAHPVAPVAPVAPVLPIAPLVQTNPLDHDLLTKLDTKVDQIQADVTVLKNLSNVYVTRTDWVEHLKWNDDHETRIRNLEKETDDYPTVKRVVYSAVGFILLAVLSAIVYLVIKK